MADAATSSEGPEVPEVVLDELDDAEFDIPAVDAVPSLESIMNEDAGRDSDPEEGPFLLVPEAGGLETGSVASKDSSEGRRSRRASPMGRSSSGSVLRHVILKGLSTQINSAAERSGAGSATAACGGGGCVCVGTSQGAVLVFDATQKLRFLLEAAEGAGAVSCLSASGDGSRLLVGHDKGLLRMFDLGAGRLLRTLPDAHAPNTALLHIKFLDSSAMAVCSDSGGSVFELSFKRVLGVRGCDARCVFSGARGEVVALEPLLLGQFGAPHPLEPMALLAMATLSKVIVVQTRPRTKVLLTQPLAAAPDSLPLLAWQMVLIQVADHSRVVDPVLAFARDHALFFYQVGVDPGGRVRAALLHRTELNYHALSLHWLNARTLAVLDTREHTHVLDVRSQTEVEALDVSSARLVFASSHFKAIATGGNVSKALALAGERACYNTVVSLGQQLLLVGTRSVHALHMRTWAERIDHLARHGKPLAALELGLAFFEERARAVVGLRGPKAHRKLLIKQKIFEVLDAFVDKMVVGEASAEELRETFATAASLCIRLQQTETLFGRYWEAASGRPAAEAAFLEVLEPHILNDELPRPPPGLMQRFVLHYESARKLQALEACLTHVEVSCLDIHQTMTLCWQHSLYDAIIHVHTQGMQDFVTPLVELLTVVQGALSTGKQLSEEQVALGNKLLVFVSCCLAGRAFPRGDVPPDLQPQVKHEVLKCLTALHSRAPTDSEPPYPYLRALLQFDTREFLNVLALAFEEPEFSSELGLRQRQRIVDILLQIVVPGDTFSASQVGALFTFLARQLARPGASVMVETHLFEHVVDFLTTPLEAPPSMPGGQHEERQQALLELLAAPQGLHFCDEHRLLQRAYDAQFYRVCEFLHQRRGEFAEIVECYLRDPLRRSQVFAFFRNMLVNPGYLDLTKTTELVLKNIKELVEIDSKKVGQLIWCHLPGLIRPILDALKDEPEVLFSFLQGLFQYREGHSGKDESQVVDPEVHETFLRLMCQLRPSEVAAFVRANNECRLEQALQAVREFGQVEAEAHLLERTGDVAAAFGLLRNQLELQLTKALQEGGDAAWGVAQARLLLVVQLGQRGFALLDEGAREALWFPLLRLLMHLRADNAQHAHNHEVLRDMCQHVLSSMLGHVGLPAVTQLMLQEPSCAQGRFGEMRDLLLSMLRSCEHEERVLRATQRILNADLHVRLSRQLRGARRPLAPHPAGAPVPASAPPLCVRCDRPLLTSATAPSPAVVFACGHAFHCACTAGASPECPLCNPGAVSAPLHRASPSKTQEFVSGKESALQRRRRQQLSPQRDSLELNLAPPPGHAHLQGLF
ncbi:vacuolar protein sorting-associated protein 8 homolog [Neocloeon triangulifer]|uniref:vacuolar protein sorting-associated protein 8 homolog n=1 Tax=Neocloeon triangulifer TaxID=2078957 RepID=UPI00286F3D47|nr:vacuolar protein sorting-associated protein 8 homolog [Neocloeon triangulifer]